VSNKFFIEELTNEKVKRRIKFVVEKNQGKRKNKNKKEIKLTIGKRY
jgi:hypothetical protein